MNLDSYKRKRKEAFTPWKREPPYSPDDVRESITLSRKEQSFYLYPQNRYLDVYTKSAALRVSTSVISLESYSGEEEIFQCSGTIIESFNTYSIILTTASLLRCSTSRNSIADNVKIQSDTPLPSASLAHISDSITIEPIQLRGTEEKCPHSNSVDLIPGDAVIALGRFYKKPFDITAATGEFSIGRCDNDDYFDCKELFVATCRIIRCGIGGPLINRYGEVIGMCFHDPGAIAFLPINIASIWWEHYKKYGQSRRPWLGMEVTNLYAADLDILENIIPKFPDVLKGVIVEELFENMWNNVGESVELAVIRSSYDSPVQLSMVVEEVT
ncbi:hypothetical protein BC332_05167 [Capsicum chinense]|nr:hypothetical protein BC332_05167 [Capsicum chinense]